MKPITTLLLLAMTTALSSAMAQTDVAPERAFYRGNEAFDAKNLDAARDAYREAIDAGYSGVALEYNLANVYQRLGDRGRAIYHYRRALRLDPRDVDATRNLDVAQRHLVDEIYRPSRPRVLDYVFWPHEKLSIGEAFALFAACFLIAMLLLHFRIVRMHPGPWYLRVAIPLLVIATFLLVSLLIRSLDLGRQPTGIILDPEVQVFTGPSDTSYSVYFNLHAGAEVDIEDQEGDWVKISVPTTATEVKKGYVPASQIGRLDGA